MFFPVQWVASLVSAVGLCLACSGPGEIRNMGQSKKKKQREVVADADANRLVTLSTNPTAQEFGVKTTGLAEVVLHTAPGSRCAEGPAIPGTSDRNFWVPDGPPRALVDKNNQTRLIVPHILTYALVGNNLNSVSLDCSAPMSQSTFNADPNQYDDASWPWSPYRLPDGSLFTVYHHEYHGFARNNCAQGMGGCWHASLTFGVAADGVHFARPTPNHALAVWPSPYNPNGPSASISDPTNIMKNPKDGKFYMIAMVYGEGDVVGRMRNCLLRTDDLLNRDAWEIWNGSGFTRSPHRDATCTSVFDIAAGLGNAPGSLTYSTYLDRFVYLFFGTREDGRQGFFMRIATNDQLTQWSQPVIALGASLPWGPPRGQNAEHNAYPSFLDPAAGGHNFDQIGQRPYLYFVRTWQGKEDREIVRVPMEFYTGEPERDNRLAGPFRVNGGARFSSGLGKYCTIGSMEQLRGCGFNDDFNALREFIDSGADQLEGGGGLCGCGLSGPVPPGGGAASPANPMSGPGSSSLPPGCYRIGPDVGGTGFYSNGQGQSCPFLAHEMPGLCSGLTVAQFVSLPLRSDHGGNREDPHCRGN